MVTFDPDQEQAILEWLRSQNEAELTLQDVIDGLESGTLSTAVSLTE